MSEPNGNSDILISPANLNNNSVASIQSDSLVSQKNCSLTLNQLSELVQKTPNEILSFIMDKKHSFLSLFKEIDVKHDFITYAIIALGKAFSSELHKDLNKLLIKISSNVNNILLNIQRYLLSLKRQENIEICHCDSLFYLTVFLRNFQLTLPSSSLDFISIILPLLTLTCKQCLKNQNDLNSIVSEKLEEINRELKQFMKHYSVFEVKNATEKEKLHLVEPPENFRSISVLPTLDDIHLPCSFLRPNITKGKYRSAEHYLDVQFRLLREDYIKPLRDGIAEYLTLKKSNRSYKSCKCVRVYSNVSIVDEEFVKGNLIHKLKFNGQDFSSVNWENSKRFLTGSLLCLSSNDFQTILFATVFYRDLTNLKNGLLRIKFEETIMENILNMSRSKDFVAIETTTYFVSYYHNLKVLQTLNGELLPMKRYIINLENTINSPQYLLPTTTYDMRPLLIPLDKKYITFLKPLKEVNKGMYNNLYNYDNDIIYIPKSITVMDDNLWPSASDLNLDESQLHALKLAVTKEFAVIQGPPGTGKTYVGLRVVQLLLHNIDKWFNNKLNSLPILIVCHTNHALDQFLEGVLQFTKEIVRIGGRGTNEAVAQFQINKLVESDSFLSRNARGRIYATKSKIRSIKHKIDETNRYIQESSMFLITQSILEVYISPDHLISLKRGDFRLPIPVRYKKNTIADWLEANEFNETSCEENFDNEKFSNFFSETNEVESEGEADVEFIENERNIDFYDFEEYSKKSKSWAHAQENKWKFQKKNKHNLYVSNMLNHNMAMKEHRVMKIKNVWCLPIDARWQLYKFWLEIFINEKKIECLDLQAELKTVFKTLSELYHEMDFTVIRGSHIVGMTTTGAAKYRHIITEMKPSILIVEEAAEVLESHIITSLASETQHVILIGDHQQLRPSPAVHMLAVKYDMNVSLFERMIKNGVDYCRLSVQHRMRPEIAALIVPHIYPNLKNHKVVTTFENIKGVSKNVFFITHNFNELLIKDSKSKVNEHEAKFLIKLCRYLLLQGYEPSQITVLTTYTGQLFALKKLATDKEKNVHFTVVDNYQGEENDIILISFVRSNDEGEVGFLKVPNRVCVALSRAKKGLYCIGNFELLAQKSNLWKNIVQTLTENQSIGPSLCLKCQNHPLKFNEVASDADFSAVPEGGCTQKCNYRLLCGHTCPLLCHQYDKAHEFICCKKPCNTVCAEGHYCPKKCFEDCGSCEVIIDRTLSQCGHTVRATCGLEEKEIICREPCNKTCDKGHKCSKKCFQYCKPCKFIVDKTLKCGHTVHTTCGKDESKICVEPCFKRCDKEHTCPKKCFEDCGSCPVIIDRTLSVCEHTVRAACGLEEKEIICHEPCNKTCDKGHKCSKKCFQYCKPCKFMLDKTLTCGHTVNAPCGKEESQINCQEPCVKVCDKGHTCPKKCFETCKKCPVIVERTLTHCGHVVKALCGNHESEITCLESCIKTCDKGHKCPQKCSQRCESCKVLVDKTLERCGHTVKAPCGMSDYVTKLCFKCEKQCNKTCKEGHQCTKKCYEICGPCTFIVNKTLPHCGHTVKVPCNRSENKIICKKKCNKLLSCGHECTNKCSEPCIIKCFEGIKIKSSVCEHIVEVECSFTESFEILQELCSKPCNKVLPCGHICKGTCSSCFQGRLHRKCEEVCGRILICGHKCTSKCFKSCPPCVKPCENRCPHGKCPRKCGIPCAKCFEQCSWSCSHKKCTRPCYEVCDREPCNRPCRKMLPCKHRCIGYCGEPCPKQCRICDKNIFHKDHQRMEIDNCEIYVYLEDCNHLFKESDLNKWLTSNTQSSQRIEMKTCPKCSNIIRRNVRFNKCIKTCIADIEKIKLIAMYNEEENFKIQRILLEHLKLSNVNSNPIYDHVKNVLASKNVRIIQELMNIGNIINIAIEIESMRYGIFSMFVSRPDLKILICYAQVCRVWLNEFICDNFLTLSEYQLGQLSDEVYRLRLICFLFELANEKFFATSSPDFENCMKCVQNFKPFSEDNVEKCEFAFQNLLKNFDSHIWNVPAKASSGLTVVNFSGNWYQCLNGHICCNINNSKVVKFICYECKRNENYNQVNISVTASNIKSENNMPSNKIHNHSLILSSKLQLSSKPSIQDIRHDESEKYGGANTSKQLGTNVISESIYKENSVVFHSKHGEKSGVNEKSMARLPSLLLKKLYMMYEVEDMKHGKYHMKNRKRKRHPSKGRDFEPNAKKSSFHNQNPHITVQQTVKSESFTASKQNWCNSLSNLDDLTVVKNYVKKSNVAQLNEAKATGAIPKSSKFYPGSHHANRKQTKSYNPYDYDLNISKSFRNGKVHHEGYRKKYTQMSSSHVVSSKDTTPNHYFNNNNNFKKVVKAESQSSLRSVVIIANSSKYDRESTSKTNVKMSQNYVTAIEGNMRSISRSYQGHRVNQGQTELLKYQYPVAKNKNSVSESCIKYQHKVSMKGSKRKIFSNDISATWNITKNSSRSYWDSHDNRRQFARFK